MKKVKKFFAALALLSFCGSGCPRSKASERVILTLKETEWAGQAGTRVIGETKKNFVGHIAQKTWTDAVFAEMACNLGVAAASLH